MSISTLPLCYCTNVHPGKTLDDVVGGLETYAIPIATVYRRPLAVGLWFADRVSQEFAEDPRAVVRLRERLDELGLTCYTLNAFPFGDFHRERVKELVYLPDWSTRERLDFTTRCAKILASLMRDGVEGSVSTLPLGFKLAPKGDDFFVSGIANLIELARRLDELHSETGRIVRLAIEPEPYCHLETTAEVVSFFQRLGEQADRLGLLGEVEQHLGVCYDVCHQAVEFEDVVESIEALRRANIRINKVQISSAIELVNPRENEQGREELSRFVEPRYLHQTFARRGSELASQPDLTQELCSQPPGEFLDADRWRVHFHVPVNETQIGSLGTTRHEMEAALGAIARLDYAPHLEVETYTWTVLPGQDRPSIVEGISRELLATDALINDVRG